MAKQIDKGACPHCGSTEGFTERYTQSVSQRYDFNGKAIGADITNERGGKVQYCSSCDRRIHISNVDELKRRS